VNTVIVLPVSVHVFGAVGVTDVDQGGVDHDSLLAAVEEVVEKSEVSIAAAYTVARAVLIQDVHLA
jgi:hypothetical protein